jgi:hypothetical protein
MDAETIYKELMEVKEMLKRKDKRYMTLKEAAIYMGMAESTLEKISRPSNMQIPYIKPNGGKKVFDVNDIDNYMATLKVGKAA